VVGGQVFSKGSVAVPELVIDSLPRCSFLEFLPTLPLLSNAPLLRKGDQETMQKGNHAKWEKQAFIAYKPE
jgi:hypothetical protein